MKQAALILPDVDEPDEPNGDWNFIRFCLEKASKRFCIIESLSLFWCLIVKLFYICRGNADYHHRLSLDF